MMLYSISYLIRHGSLAFDSEKLLLLRGFLVDIFIALFIN